MKYAKFACGCTFPITDDGKITFDVDWDNLNYDCRATWDLISSGNTKGVFQIESRFGRQLSKQARVDSIEDLGNLISIMRPGCVSGDTKVVVNHRFRKNGIISLIKYKLRDIYNNKERYEYVKSPLVSFDEISGNLIRNGVNTIIYSGIKEVFRVKCKIDNRQRYSNYYDLECTDDHKLLTTTGWKELKNISMGERILVLRHKGTKKPNPEKGFRNICFKNYQYRCVFCNWSEGSLDVNHLEGNRKTNNHPDNLCFLCPNHHRLYSEGKITKQQVLIEREALKLRNYEHLIWVEYNGKESLGEKDVYDISMCSPHHNFIAGNIVVHNCTEAFIDGKNLTTHYLDRKAKREEVSYLHPSLEQVLKPTYGILVYQEQAMRISQELAGFNLMEADDLRKAAGKKKADLMAKIKVKFLAGCKKMGIVNDKEAEEIWGWIEASQRYSFNKSHAIGYAYMGYLTAYIKQHFPLEMFTSWLAHAGEKGGKKKEEIQELISNAKKMSFEINRPSYLLLNRHFQIYDGEIYFGFTEVSGVGDSVFDKLVRITTELEIELGLRKDWSYMDLLMKLFTNKIGSKALKALISVGTFDHICSKRTKMLYEFDQISQLTDKPLEWCIANYRSYSSVTDLIKACLNSYKFRQPSSKQKVLGIVNALEKPPFKLDDTAEFLAGEESRLLGVALTCSAVDACDTSMANSSCKDFLNGRSEYTMLAVHIDNVKETVIKKGNSVGRKMGFMSVSDSSCSLDRVVVFCDVWENVRSILTPGNTVLIGGKKSYRDESFVVEKVWQL